MERLAHTTPGPASRRDLPLWRRARRRAYWLLLLVLLGAAERLPLGWGRTLCSGLAGLGARLRSREAACAQTNLARAFPDLPVGERRRLMDRSVSALGANLFDALAARRLLDAGLVTGPEHGEQLVPLLERLAGPGRGVLVLTGHLGCWELLGGWLARQVEAAGLGTLAVVTGTLHNPPVDRVVQERRRALGLKPLPREEGARPLVAHLRAGQVAAILLDQNTSARSLAVPFFGRPARTATGLAQMALKYGIPVLPVAIARYGKGHRVVWLDPLLPDPAGGTGDRADLERFLIRCNRSLETLIRRNPAEWVWFHRRWEAAAETGPSAGTGADPNGS